MTRRQQLTPATIELHRDRHGQALDVRDPLVAKWAIECGLVSGPVEIRLIGEQDDLTAQIKRLERAFGSLVHFSLPRQQRDGVLYIAYGTMLA